jgi:hypothetical protein
MTTIKIKTIYGQIFTIKVKEQNSEFISGFDKFGTFTKILLKNIEECNSLKEEDGK